MRRPLLLAAALLALAPAPAAGAPAPRVAAGPDPAAIAPALAAFRADLGPLEAISWEDAPDVVSPSRYDDRGVLLSSPAGVSAFRVSGRRFGDIDPTYPLLFQPFSGVRLFAPAGTTVTELSFVLPGTRRPATVNGVGAVFTSVDLAGASYVKLYGPSGELLRTEPAPAGALSFVGVSFDAGERIARAQLVSGTTPLAAGVSDTTSVDVVALDDLVFGQPAQPRLSVADVTVSEGAGVARFALTRDVDLATPVAVGYATAPETAQEGADYEGRSGVLRLAPGQAAATIDVPVRADDADEPDERLALVLLGDDRVTLAAPRGHATIRDDDVPQPTTTPTPSDRTRPVARIRGVRSAGCVRRDFTVSVTIVEDDLAAREVRLDRRLLSSWARAAAATERLRLRVPAAKLRRGRHRIVVTASDRAGNATRRTARFRRC